MFVLESAVKAMKAAGDKCSAVEEKITYAEKALARMRELPIPTTEGVLGQWRRDAARATGDEQWEICLKISEAEKENARIREETVRRGSLARQLRGNAEAEARKTARRCLQNLAKEAESLLRNRLPLFQHDPSLAPNRVAEIVVLAEAIDRAFFPEGVKPDLLSILDADIARVVIAKRAKTSVAV